jgi:7-carboxy-7-deazaguanine synthase
MTAEEIWSKLIELGDDRFSHVTISGGNPALLANLSELIGLLKEKGKKIAIETQGSKYQEWLKDIDDLTISPKPPSSGMITDFEKLDQIIGKLRNSNQQQSISLKVVVFDTTDLQYAKDVHLRYPSIPFYLQVGNEDIHEAETNKLVQTLLEKYETLIDQVIEDKELNNIRVLPQLHTLVWGNKRGV